MTREHTVVDILWRGDLGSKRVVADALGTTVKDASADICKFWMLSETCVFSMMVPANQLSEAVKVINGAGGKVSGFVF